MKFLFDRRGLALSTVAACLLASPILAERYVIPASAHANGQNGARYRTDLTIVNPGASAASVSIRFLPADEDNATLPTPATKTVPANGQIALDDIVDSLFARSGGGSIFVDSTTTGLVVASRTYNQLPDRSYGMYLPGALADSALPVGQTGHLVFLAKSDVYRSNVGFASTTGTLGTATVRLYGGSGQLLGTTSREVKPFGQTQINDVFDAAGANATTVARAEVTATVPLFAYATVIDNRTGDPFPVLAVRSSTAATSLVLTAAAHASGANDSKFRSDLRVFNTSESQATLTLGLYVRDQSTPNPETRSITLGGRQLLALDDVILATFGKDGVSGAITLTSNRPLLALSRTYNVAADGSTSGQELPAIPLTDYLVTGDTARFAALSNRNARTNLIFFNSGPQTDVTLTFRGGGNVVTRTLLASSMSQINSVLDELGVPADSTGSLDVTSTTPNAKYWALATVIDAGSNDPFQVGPAITRFQIPNGGGGCIDVAYPRLNVAFPYLSTTSGGASQTSQTSYLIVNNTTTRTRTLASTSIASTDTTSTLTYAVDSAGLVNLSRIDTSTQTFGFTISSVLTCTPSQITGPSVRFCEGATWDSPSVSQTLVNNPGPTINSQSVSGNGKVTAVNESLTSSFGRTFNTVHITRNFNATGTATVKQEQWAAVDEGILVKEISTNADGSSSTTVLTGLP
ncbi:MAG: hypothetical protein ABIT01_10205 [Thermoanaerobaculia bacterium]